MRILFFAPRKCWPLNSGARLRDYYLARELARHASVTYLGLCYPEEEQYEAADIGLPAPETIFEKVITMPKARPYGGINLVRGLLGPDPVTVLNWTSKEAADELAEIGRAGNFDAVHLVGVHLTRYVPVLKNFPGAPPVLCDWHDIQSEKMWRYSETIASRPRRIYARRTAQLLEKAEQALLHSCQVHTVVSRRDQTKLETLAAAPIHVIENGVDTSYFVPKESDGEAVPDSILFVGAMDYAPNEDAVTWFASNVWRQLRPRFPELRFTIVGRKPTPGVMALKDQPGIEVSGTVADVRPYYKSALAVVVPLHWGSGTRLKILEAMSAGVPVISTTLGAEGLDATHGQDILIADSGEEMLAAVATLRESPALRESLVEHGRRLALSKYDWAIPGGRLFSIHAGMVAARRPNTNAK
jgi:sugar transferase (PEP-CTERM/EpsH1 system associated)